jgi:hypothetical protein
MLSDELLEIAQQCAQKTLNNYIPNLEAKELYHYTSLDGAKSIIESGNFRLTDVRFLNDPNELYDGVNIFLEKIIKLRKEKLTVHEQKILFCIHLCLIDFFFFKESDAYKSEMETFERFDLEEGLVAPKLKKSYFDMGMFVISFCECGYDETLRNWVHYADDGRGVCLTFDGMKKDSLTHSLCIDSKLMLHRVVYLQEAEKNNYAESLLRSIIDKVGKKELGDRDFMSCVYDIMTVIAHNCISSKHPAYKDEKEWRGSLMIPRYGSVSKELKSNEVVKYENRNRILTPFYDEVFNKESLKKITLGPRLNTLLNTHSFRALLDDCNYAKAIELKSSVIKYRG